MPTRLTSFMAFLALASPLMSATEVERLRALCQEQEMQIQQLELKIARLTDTPPPSIQRKASSSEPSQQTATPTYTVKSGDSVERIARREGVSVSSINKLNGLKATSIIHPGQKLKLPSTTQVATQNLASTPSSSVEKKSYTVASGDTFYRIASQHGISVAQLSAANPEIDPRALRIGQKIRLNTSRASVSAPNQPEKSVSFESAPALPVSNAEPVAERRASNKPIKIEAEITYGQFAKNHGTTTKRLDALNGLELDPSTVLAQGSELYIPAQP
ncbi:MAG: LysM peptidoglycan-binding domain-containing protein [Akkermansiaceae bacterium]